MKLDQLQPKIPVVLLKQHVSIDPKTLRRIKLDKKFEAKAKEFAQRMHKEIERQLLQGISPSTTAANTSSVGGFGPIANIQS